MAEEAIVKLLRYIEPLIIFGGNHIDENGYIRLIGDVERVYRSEDKETGKKKDLRVPRSYHEWGVIKKEEESEIFNPFVNKRHMFLVCEMVKAKLSDILADDDDIFIEEEFVDNVGISQVTENGMINVSFVDLTDDEDVATGSWIEEKLAMWCACADALRKFNKRNPPEFALDPYLSVPTINRLIEKSVAERKRVIADERIDDGVNSEILDDSEDRHISRDYDLDDYLFLPDDYAPGEEPEEGDDDFDEEDSLILPSFLDVRIDDLDTLPKDSIAARAIEDEMESKFAKMLFGFDRNQPELDDVELS